MNTLTHIRASRLLDYDVKNAHDENIGEIEDLVVDASTGECIYAVLSFGGVLGIGEKFFAVPLSAMTFNDEDKIAVLNVEKEKLNRAPGFDKDEWPNMADAQWSRSIYSYYGVSPQSRTHL